MALTRPLPGTRCDVVLMNHLVACCDRAHRWELATSLCQPPVFRVVGVFEVS